MLTGDIMPTFSRRALIVWRAYLYLSAEAANAILAGPSLRTIHNSVSDIA